MHLRNQHGTAKARLVQKFSVVGFTFSVFKLPRYIPSPENKQSLVFEFVCYCICS